MKKVDYEELSTELDELTAILEIIALYVGDVTSDKPQLDMVNSTIMCDALRGCANFSRRIGKDLD